MNCADHAEIYPRWEPPMGAVLLAVDGDDRLHYATHDGVGFCELITRPV